MARPQADEGLVPSVLDRLIDREPRASAEPDSRRSVRLSDIKDAVKRDLEWLLNSRRSAIEVPPVLGQVADSLLSFGLPDFTHSSLSRADDRVLLQEAIRTAIARFEPRLSRVGVTLVEGERYDRSLRFRIDAMLDAEPTPEVVSFDSVLQLPTKAFVMEGE